MTSLAMSARANRRTNKTLITRVAPITARNLGECMCRVACMRTPCALDEAAPAPMLPLCRESQISSMCRLPSAAPHSSISPNVVERQDEACLVRAIMRIRARYPASARDFSLALVGYPGLGVGITNFNVELAVWRWVRGFHAALWRPPWR